MNKPLANFAAKTSLVTTTAYIGAMSWAGGVFAQERAGTSAVDQATQNAAQAIKAGATQNTNTVAGDVTLKKGFAPNLGKLITSVLTLVMLIAALMILMYLIWGGIQWITSGGDKGKTEEARNKITSAVVGLIILAAAWAVFLIILKFLGFASYQDLFANIVNVKGGK